MREVLFVPFITDDAVVQTGQNLNTLNYNEMPAFGVVGNLVEEEVLN